MGVGPASLFLLYYFWFFLFYNIQENLQILIYKNIKNTIRNPKNLPECHCIGKRLKYPWISQKITKMPLVARVAHARLLLEAVKFSGEISDQQMVDSSRSKGEDSDDGGLDDRWWLMRENRRFEAPGGRRKSWPFSGQIGRRKHWKRPGFCFIGGYQPFCGGSEASRGWKWEIRWERERIVGERRDRLRDFATVWTRAWYTGAAEGCELLDRGWTDPSVVIGLIWKLIGRSRRAELWSGMARYTESLVHRVTWHNRIEGPFVLRAEMDLSFNLVW